LCGRGSGADSVVRLVAHVQVEILRARGATQLFFGGARVKRQRAAAGQTEALARKPALLKVKTETLCNANREIGVSGLGGLAGGQVFEHGLQGAGVRDLAVWGEVVDEVGQ